MHPSARVPHMGMLSPRNLGAFVIAGAVFALMAIVGLHDLDHLTGAAGKTDDCPACARSHGSSTGIREGPLGTGTVAARVDMDRGS